MSGRLKRFGAALGLVSLLASPAAAQVGEHKPVPVSGEPVIPVKKQPRFSYGVNVDNNICRLPETWCHYGDKTLPDLKAIGVDTVRYAIYWNIINPSPGVFDWRLPDKFMKEAEANNIEVIGSIWGGPSWATGGKGWWEPYHCSVLAYPGLDPKDYEKDPSTGEDVWGFRYDLPECVSPTPIDTKLYQEFISTVVKRYPHMRGLNIVNEVANYFSWPYRFKHRHESDVDSLRELMAQVIIPGNAAARQAAKERGVPIVMVGPDDFKAGILDAWYQWDKILTPTGDPRLSDVPSHHMYGGDDVFPAEPLDVLRKEILPILKRYNAGRLLITETGYKPNSIKDDPAGSLVRQSELMTGTFGIPGRSALGFAPVTYPDNMLDNLWSIPEIAGVLIYRGYDTCQDNGFGLICGMVIDPTKWAGPENVNDVKRNVFYGLEEFIARKRR